MTTEQIRIVLSELLNSELVSFKETKFGYIKFTTLDGRTGKVEIVKGINVPDKVKWFCGNRSGIMTKLFNDPNFNPQDN